MRYTAPLGSLWSYIDTINSGEKTRAHIANNVVSIMYVPGGMR